MSKKWICVEIVCDEEVVEELGAEVAEAFEKSIEVTDKGIRFYLEASPLRQDWETQLQQLLQGFDLRRRGKAVIRYEQSSLIEENWAEAWKVHFKPLRVGKHFLVCPTWEHVVPESRDRVILVDPGRAFGTGHHETTRLCLEWLEEWAMGRTDLGAHSLLDVGSGTGILAIGAALLGVGRILGIDSDPEAVEIAAENVTINRLAGKIRLLVGTVGDVDRAEKFDIIVANIQAFPLIEMAGKLVARLRGSGKLVLSGILLEQRTDVQIAYEAVGMRVANTRSAGEWCLLEFEMSGKE
jgi:ribosomal protein L11 methyltransferase